MIELLGLAVTGAAGLFGYIKSRQFVRNRLRFVDSAQSPKAPWIAGGLALLVVVPLTAIPLVGTFVSGLTAIVFGASVGLGVAAGARDVKRLSSGL